MQQKYSLSYIWRIALGSLAIFFSLQTIINVTNLIMSSSIKIQDGFLLYHIINFSGRLLELAAMILFAVFILTFNRKTRLKLNIIF